MNSSVTECRFCGRPDSHEMCKAKEDIINTHNKYLGDYVDSILRPEGISASLCNYRTEQGMVYLNTLLNMQKRTTLLFSTERVKMIYRYIANMYLRRGANMTDVYFQEETDIQLQDSTMKCEWAKEGVTEEYLRQFDELSCGRLVSLDPVTTMPDLFGPAEPGKRHKRGKKSSVRVQVMGEVCPVCMDVPTNVTAGCGHSLCDMCLSCLLEKNHDTEGEDYDDDEDFAKCPICRANIKAIVCTDKVVFQKMSDLLKKWLKPRLRFVEGSTLPGYLADAEGAMGLVEDCVDKSCASDDESCTSEDKSCTSDDESCTSEDESCTSEYESCASEDKSCTSEDESCTNVDESCTFSTCCLHVHKSFETLCQN